MIKQKYMLVKVDHSVVFIRTAGKCCFSAILVGAKSDCLEFFLNPDKTVAPELPGGKQSHIQQ